MTDIDLTITGIQEAQNENAKRIAALQPSGALGRVVRDATIETHRYVVSITHVDTGSLRASHRMEVQDVRGRIFIDPTSINPRSGQRPAEYGPIEHARGGSHAFYERTAREAGARIAERAMAELIKALE